MGCLSVRLRLHRDQPVAAHLGLAVDECRATATLCNHYPEGEGEVPPSSPLTDGDDGDTDDVSMTRGAGWFPASYVRNPTAQELKNLQNALAGVSEGELESQLAELDRKNKEVRKNRRLKKNNKRVKKL